MTLKQPDTGKTYSNLIEANKASWRDAVIPFLETLAASLTKAVRANRFAYGDMVFDADPLLSVRFDTSQIEELAADADKIAERVARLINATSPIITLNEARTMLGLAEMEDGDELAERQEPQTDAEDDTPDDTENDTTETQDDGREER